MSLISASSLSGYEKVKDLIPEGHFLRYTMVWAFRMERYVTELNELERRLVLDLGKDLELNEEPLIRISMSQPTQCMIPDQIVGLGFEEIREQWWENVAYRVYDYEMTNFSVKCQKIELSRAAKPAL